MELALPVLLKLFPNMLPSTFQDKLKHEARAPAGLLGCELRNTNGSRSHHRSR
jgi:hypothetical protein